MILLIDVGNTNIVIGGAEAGGDICFTARLATDIYKTSDEYAVLFKGVLCLRGVDSGDIQGAAISSVVPPLTGTLEKAVRLFCGLTPLVLGPGVKTGLNILIDDPAQAGSDLIADAVAAAARYQLPLIVIDMGTATTLSTLNKNGAYIGNIICPGVELATEALFAKASKLPRVSYDAPRRVIGKNTEDSMKSGLIFGNAAMLDGLIDRIEGELGESATVVATGGLASSIVPHCRRDVIYNEHLVLLGLLDIYSAAEKRNA